MPKKEVPLRRSCGAMAAHMMLLEQYPSFRLAQMRLEGATEKRRDRGHDVAKSQLVTVKTVVNVVDGSPAAAAGLRPEDLVVEVDGTAVERVDDLQRLMVAELIGHRVTLTVVRGDRTHKLTLVPVELDG